LSGRRFGDWLSEALEDLYVAKILLREGKYGASCFHSQQAAEKASKALLLLHGRSEPGHSISELLLTARMEGVDVTDDPYKVWEDPRQILHPHPVTQRL
jgi:HEPN domain-containing protein